MRFHKLGADGARLPAYATAYDAIEDTATGLIWSKTLKADVTQKKAAKIAADCKVAGFADWQLPTIAQLETLRDLERFSPATHEVFASDTRNDWYWSSSASAADPDYAWGVGFYNGLVDWGYRYNRGCVRAVRSAAPVAGQ